MYRGDTFSFRKLKVKNVNAQGTIIVVGGMVADVSCSNAVVHAVHPRTVGGQLAFVRVSHLRPSTSQFRILKYSVISIALQRYSTKTYGVNVSHKT